MIKQTHLQQHTLLLNVYTDIKMGSALSSSAVTLFYISFRSHLPDLHILSQQEAAKSWKKL